MPVMESPRSRISRAHGGLGQIVMIAVPLTALPLASNRPMWWLLWTAFFAAIALFYTLRLGLASLRYRPRVLDHQAIGAALLVLPVWAFVQTLPLDSLFSASSLTMAAGLEAVGGRSVSVQPGAAVSGICRYLGYLVLAALVLEVATRRDRVLRMALWIFAGVCLQAVWAVVALRFMGDFSPFGTKVAYLGSATGTFVNRNALATYLGFGLILGLGILAERKGQGGIRASRQAEWYARLQGGDLAVTVGLCLVFIALVFTQSRLGLLGSVAGAVVTVVLTRIRAGRSFGGTAVAAVTVLLGTVLVVALLAQGDGVADRMLFVGNEAVNRLALYRQVIDMIAARPFTGFGMDAFAMAFEAFRRPPLLAPVSYDLAHSSYLMLWVEFGVVAGSVPVVTLGVVGLGLWRRLRAPEGFGGIAAAGIGALVLGAVHSIADFSLEIPANVYLLVAILALGLGRQARQGAAGPAQ